MALKRNFMAPENRRRAEVLQSLGLLNVNGGMRSARSQLNPGVHPPRATVQTMISRAPSFRSARAQALVVAPVVSTSSTRTTHRPLTGSGFVTAKAFRMLRARCFRVSKVWV